MVIVPIGPAIHNTDRLQTVQGHVVLTERNQADVSFLNCIVPRMNAQRLVLIVLAVLIEAEAVGMFVSAARGKGIIPSLLIGLVLTGAVLSIVWNTLKPNLVARRQARRN